MGLGLAIVQRLTGLLGIPLQVHSVVSQGSIFSIEVPRIAPPKYASPQLAVQRFNEKGANILVLDDDEDSLVAITYALESTFNRVLAFSSLPEAVRLPSEVLVDLIITDYDLGEKTNGIEAIERIRQQFGFAFPAILVTGVTEANVEEQLPTKTTLLLKPLNPIDLQNIVVQMLNEPSSEFSPP